MEKNAAFSGSIPENYDRYLGPLLFEPYAMDIVSRIRKEKVTNIVELACGTGRVTKYLFRYFTGSAKITATDLNADMIAVARKQVLDRSINWMTADMQELPFQDNTFDLAVCQYGIMFVPDKPKAIREIARVLKKGSIFHFNTWDKIENNGVPWIAKKTVTDYFNGEEPSFYAVPFSMHDPEEIRSLMMENGFSKVEIDLVKKEGQSPSAEDATLGIIKGNPFFNEISQKDPGAVGKLMDLIRNGIAAAYGDNPVRCPLQAWVGKAEK
ncbi:MAG TPA: class I SAM-dependent methyltransferase [Cyclobacteriaceae bacterium]|nr:class I SAM-dependent methyltransferase [Cyclobacteriaceae bacterium]